MVGLILMRKGMGFLWKLRCEGELDGKRYLFPCDKNVEVDMESW